MSEEKKLPVSEVSNRVLKTAHHRVYEATLSSTTAATTHFAAFTGCSTVNGPASSLVLLPLAFPLVTTTLLDPCLGLSFMRAGVDALALTVHRGIENDIALLFRSSIASRSSDDRGERITVGVDIAAVHAPATLVARVDVTMILRAARNRAIDTRFDDASSSDAARIRIPVAMAEDSAAAYAALSSDPNPIFVDDEAARLASLPERAVPSGALFVRAAKALLDQNSDTGDAFKVAAEIRRAHFHSESLVFDGAVDIARPRPFSVRLSTTGEQLLRGTLS